MDKTHNKKCPFCIKNGMVDILAQTNQAYLIKVLDQAGKVVPGCYFIIPKAHTERLEDLPNNWQYHLNKLLPLIPEVAGGADYNLSYNVGRAAGQRLPHVHCWIVTRQGEKGQPSYELGLAALIKKLNGIVKGLNAISLH